MTQMGEAQKPHGTDKQGKAANPPQRFFEPSAVKGLEREPEPLIQQTAPEPEKETEKRRPVPHVTQWVCREEVIWHRSDFGAVRYEKGTVISVEFPPHVTPHRWDYAREFWYPEGVEIVDLNTMTALPRQFEPIDPRGARETVELWHTILVNPKMLNYARANVPVGAAPVNRVPNPFMFKFEAEDRARLVADLDIPEPLDVKSLVKPPDQPERFNPADLSARTAGGRAGAF
jgi:hypothetical protein